MYGSSISRINPTFGMLSFIKRLAVWLRSYTGSILHRQAAALQREAKNHENTALLVTLGSIWILVGRFSGIVLISAVGGLILAYGILQLLK